MKLSIKKTILPLALVILCISILLAKAIRIDSGETYTVKIVQKTAVPGGAGNVRKLICDLNGNLIRVTYDWHAATEVGSEIVVRKLNRLLWSPIYTAL